MTDRVVNVKLGMSVRDYARGAKEAGKETDDLRNKAERLAKTYSGKVELNGIAKANAEAAELRKRLERLEGRYTATVNMNMRGAQRDVALIMNSLFALGPAAVTAGAVAGGAMVALGSTIATVGAGIGVSILAFQGVGDALKAMGDADAAAGKNALAAAADRTASTRSIDAARSSVVKAEQDQARAAKAGARDIADARSAVQKATTDAAWANAQAAERVADATDDEAAAHQKLRYALEELSVERQQAIRDMEDMRERSSDLALDERDANVRLADARDDLTTAEKTAGVTARDLEKARIAVARAEDHLSDVQRDRGRQTVDLNAAEKVGLDGLSNVVAARRNVEAAEKGVAESKADLIKAQAEQTRTEQEGSAKIAGAVRDLQDARDAAAQRNEDAAATVRESQVRLEQAVADASIKMGEQSTEAQKLAKELGQLAPAGAAFAKYLYDLKPRMKELQELAQAGLFPGVEDGIGDLMVIFPDVAYMVDRMAKGLGDMAAQAGDALSDPFWQDFFRFLGDEAGPTFESFFKIGERVARGLAGVQMAFNPMASDLIGGLEDMADRFARWGTSLSSNQGFQKFIAYVEENGPEVVATIGSIASMIGNVAEAAAPIGPVVLTVIKGLADTLGFIASIPGVGSTLVTVGVAMGALNLALRGMEIAKFSRLGQFLGALPAQTAKAGDAAGMMALRMGASGEAAQGLADRTSKVARGMDGLGRSLPIIGVALIGLGMAYQEFGSKAEENAQKAINGSLTLAEAIKAEQAQVEKNQLWWFSAAQKQNTYASAAADVTREFWEQYNALGPLEQKQADVAMAQDLFNKRLRDFGMESPLTRDALVDLRSKSRELELQQIMSSEGVDRHTASLLRQRDVMMEATNATMAYDRAAISFEQAQIRATEATRLNGAGSLEARDANLSLKESAVRAAEAAGEKARADAEARDESQTATFQAQAQKDEYLRLAATTKEPLRSELQALADRVGTLPSGNFTVTGTGEISLGASVQQALGGATGHIADIIGQARNATNRARGGVLPGYTPGRDVHSFYSPTAGFLNLSGGEGILRPEATSAIGGAAGLEGINRAARTGGRKGVSKYLGGFASGGVVMAGVQPFTKIADTLHSSLTHGLVEGIAPQLDQQMANVAAMSGGGNALAWAAGEAGKPYVWGGVGPHGYDCSGFMAAIMNVMDGKNPHMRRGTTSTFPWPGMEPGFGPGLSVGNTRNAGGGIGHMAGTIGGVNVESRGGVGVLVGSKARGARDPLFDSIYHFLGKGEFSSGRSSAMEGGSVAIWANMVKAALARVGQPVSLMDTVLRRMNQESGGNPRAINNWDSNARRGTPSKGLMQVIDPTFAAYRDPGLVNNIWDPMANTVASMRYTLRRYGSLPAGYNRAGGYDQGGVANGVGYMAKATIAPERVLSPRQTVAFETLVDDLTRPRPVPYMQPAMAGGGGGSNRPVEITNHNTFRETVDVDLFNQRQEFSIRSASF